MYNQLQDFSRNPNFIEFVHITIDNLNQVDPEGIVQGIQVGIDRFWLQCWLAQYFNIVPPKGTLRWIKTFIDSYSIDFNYRPSRWIDYCKMSRYSADITSPIYIKFMLLQPVEVVRFPRFWQDHPILYEVRPLCRGFSILSRFTGSKHISPGASIGRKAPDSPGTAGGFLVDSNTDTKYLVSCAHVMGNQGDEIFYPAPRDSVKPEKVGDVVFSQIPNPQAFKCNRVISPQALDVDLALVEVDDNITFDPDIPSVGPVDTISLIKDMSPGDEVFFYGRSSGQVEAELSSLSVMQTIEIDKQLHCFSDLFVMIPRRPFYVNTNLAKGGDSGAWIVNETNNNTVAWDGMLIGGDGFQAFGCFAENVKAQCDSYNNNLTLIP